MQFMQESSTDQLKAVSVGPTLLRRLHDTVRKLDSVIHQIAIF